MAEREMLPDIPLSAIGESDQVLIVDTSDVRTIASELRQLVDRARRADGASPLLTSAMDSAAWLEDLAAEIERCGYIAKQSYARQRLEEFQHEQKKVEAERTKDEVR